MFDSSWIKCEEALGPSSARRDLHMLSLSAWGWRLLCDMLCAECRKQRWSTVPTCHCEDADDFSADLLLIFAQLRSTYAQGTKISKKHLRRFNAKTCAKISEPRHIHQKQSARQTLSTINRCGNSMSLEDANNCHLQKRSQNFCQTTSPKS